LQGKVLRVAYSVTACTVYWVCIHSGFSEQASIEDFPSDIFVWFILISVNDENDAGEARRKNESSDL
jgi:hypothetical protein